MLTPEITSVWSGRAKAGGHQGGAPEGSRPYANKDANPYMFVVEDAALINGGWLTTEISEAGGDDETDSEVAVELGPAVMAVLKSWEWEMDTTQRNWIAAAAGIGGTKIADLGRGSDPYDAMLVDVAAALATFQESTLPQAEAYSMHVTHGSSDSDGTSQAAYEAALETWRSEWAADMNALTGRSDTPILTIDMHSFEFFAQDQANEDGCKAIHAAQRAANDEALIYNCGARPTYGMSSVDGLHYMSWGHYLRLAEQHAKVTRRVLVDGETSWKPLQYTSITAQPGNIVRVALEGGVGAARLDLRPQRGVGFHDGDVKGFVYNDDGNAAAWRVDVQASHIDVHLTEAPSTNPVLSHGWTSKNTLANTGRYPVDAWGLGRIYVRDSEDTYRSYVDGDPIYSWLCPFIEVPVV